MVAPSFTDEVTEEPIAKPAHSVGFSIFRKEAHIKASIFFISFFRETPLEHVGRKKTTKSGG
jgi:hypothetical protein